MKKVTKEALKKSVAAANRRVAKENKAFEKMTPSQKRMQIANDVLEQLRIKRLKAKTGVWLNTEKFLTKKEVEKNVELQDLLKKQKSCDACAIGGMFMCAVELADKLKTSELLCGFKSGKDLPKEYKTLNGHAEDSNDVEVPDPGIEMFDAFSYLEKFFSKDQLRLIELAFEAGNGGVDPDSDDDFDAAEYFKYEDFRSDEYGEEVRETYSLGDPSLRMRLLMENILANKGKFVPSKKPTFQMVWSTPGFK